MGISKSFQIEVAIEFATIRNSVDLAQLICKVYKEYHHSFGTKANSWELDPDLNISSELLNEFVNFKKEYYNSFIIVKKSGGFREINAPNEPLNSILKCLNIVFQCVFSTHNSAHGFAKGKSIVSNAENHISKNYVYNIDIKDFFTSINIETVFNALLKKISKINNQASNYEIINLVNLISNICCFKDDNKRLKVLPQGSPTSPILSNMVAVNMDNELFEISKKYGVTYSRYADDITFSSIHNVYQESSNFIQDVSKIIINQGFELNHKKTRLQGKNYRQVVTGLTVNEKININSKFVKQLRVLIHLLKKYGKDESQIIFKHKTKGKNPNLYKVVVGKLLFMKMVKGPVDPTYLTLRKKFDQYCKSSAKSGLI